MVVGGGAGSPSAARPAEERATAAGAICRKVRRDVLAIGDSLFRFGGRDLVERRCVRRHFERLTAPRRSQVFLRPEVPNRAITRKAEVGPVHLDRLLAAVA